MWKKIIEHEYFLTHEELRYKNNRIRFDKNGFLMLFYEDLVFLGKTNWIYLNGKRYNLFCPQFVSPCDKMNK